MEETGANSWPVINLVANTFIKVLPARPLPGWRDARETYMAETRAHENVFVKGRASHTTSPNSNFNSEDHKPGITRPGCR
jgi:3-methyladenine DNA glycosylase AlkD